MKDMIQFEFEEKPVRTTLDEKGNPWWVAKDVCEILEITDHHQAVRRLDYDERGMCKIHTPFDGSDEKGVKKVYPPGGPQEMITISESGLYTLIIRSNKPEAKKFRKWITAEVLPAIRKNGFYDMSGEARPGIVWDEMGGVSKSTGLKKSQRIRLMELAQRTVQMDPELLSQMAGMYGAMCRAVCGGPDPGEPAKNGGSMADDVMDDFISEKCRVNPEATTPKSMVYAAYEHFCKKRGARALVRSRFFTRLYQTVDDTAPARRRTKTGLKWCVAGLEIKPVPVVAITG